MDTTTVGFHGIRIPANWMNEIQRQAEEWWNSEPRMEGCNVEEAVNKWYRDKLRSVYQDDRCFADFVSDQYSKHGTTIGGTRAGYARKIIERAFNLTGVTGLVLKRGQHRSTLDRRNKTRKYLRLSAKASELLTQYGSLKRKLGVNQGDGELVSNLIEKSFPTQIEKMVGMV